MAQKINGKPVEDCFRPELEEYAIRTLGHRPVFVSRLPLSQLQDYVRKDKQYESKPDNVPVVQATPFNANVTDAPMSSTAAFLAALSNDIVPQVESKLAARIDALQESLKAEFAAALDNRPKEIAIRIQTPDGEKLLAAEKRHHKFPEVFRVVVSGVPVYLHGPAGSGKTYLGEQLARALSELLGVEVKSFHQSFGPASQMHEIFGIPAVNGHPAQTTPTWDAWSQPSVLLLDELDAAPELFVAMNAAIGNGYCVFADGKRHVKHEHCYVLAAGNTTMAGATVTYTSRSRQDKATVDRFAFVEWGYDEALEIAVAGDDMAKWTRHVQSLRRGLTALGASAPDILITPRASINGAKVLRRFPDMPWSELEDSFIWKGASEDDKAKVRRAAKG